jgi:hypothetical protein
MSRLVRTCLPMSEYVSKRALLPVEAKPQHGIHGICILLRDVQGTLSKTEVECAAAGDELCKLRPKMRV